MSATNHTQNYDLSQFVGGDIPSWLGDYNGDMGKIDAAIAEVASGAGSTASEVNSLKSRMTAAEADIDTAEGNITQLQTTTSSQGASISTNTTNIASLDTRVTALEQGGSGDYDFDLTAHTGTPTVTAESGGTISSEHMQYALNDGKTIGKINGGFKVGGSYSLVADQWTKIATISDANFPTRSADVDVMLGFASYDNGSGIDYNPAKLVFKANGNVEFHMMGRGTGSTAQEVHVSLPPCIYFL